MKKTFGLLCEGEGNIKNKKANKSEKTKKASLK